MKNKYLIHLLKAITIYILLFMLFSIFSFSSPGGPCSPGLGTLFLLIALPFIVLFLLIYSASKIKKEKAYILSFCIHLLAAIIVLIKLPALF
jgi:hypothetical protein